jgi:hypothetical protein
LTGTLTIPSGVTSISAGVFSGCSGLTGTLVIPESVTSIGNYTFSDCSGLTGTLTIPAGVTTIGAGAFYNCSELTSITLLSESKISYSTYMLYGTQFTTGSRADVYIYVKANILDSYKQDAG